MYSLGIDIGSSSVKVSLLDIESGKCIASSTNPSSEMPIKALHPGWAEQDPEMWWGYVCKGIKDLSAKADVSKIACIGVSYQMHGLVTLDCDMKPVRDSIIWCDSRAVETGREAMEAIGREKCLEHLLNSPGNFTASKLAWVKRNEPQLYAKTVKFCLPGDYIIYKLSGKLNTSSTGLSEQILWDFKQNSIASFVQNFFGIDEGLVPEIVPAIGIQSQTSGQTFRELGIKEGTPISYRAGDQPNNAFSLNVLDAGEIAATGGTSGVVYGVSDIPKADPLSRVNTFVHVNHTRENPRYGILLCINGTGIMNAWTRRNFAHGLDYDGINSLAASAPAGSDGVRVLPFGNGAERVLENNCTGARISGLDLNRHSLANVLRATQEGIAYSFRYGIDIMKGLGLKPDVIRAGRANMFLSPVFRQTLSTLTGSSVELYDTDGALGAARGAALGAGLYSSREECFASLEKLELVSPCSNDLQALEESYLAWKEELELALKCK